MKVTIKTVRLEAVKDRKVETILFIDTDADIAHLMGAESEVNN